MGSDTSCLYLGSVTTGLPKIVQNTVARGEAQFQLPETLNKLQGESIDEKVNPLDLLDSFLCLGGG
jgi:hypothetical protein